MEAFSKTQSMEKTRPSANIIKNYWVENPKIE